MPRRRGRSSWRGLVVVVLAAALAGCGGEGSSAPTTTTETETETDTPSPAGPGPSEVALAMVIAHRGASEQAPEHTFAAYDLAVEQGADYLEQDLHLTADGELVVLHDLTLDRTARGPDDACTGPVADKTLAQLERCDVGAWYDEAHPDRADPAHEGLRIPTMGAVLDRYGSDVRYYIELKVPGAEEALLRVLDEADLAESSAGLPPVIVQSFLPDVLRRVHALRPDLPLVQLFLREATVDEDTLDRVAAYAVGIGPAAADVTASLVVAASERCLDVHPYTVDDPDEMDRLLEAGVGGMFTNAPERLLERRAHHPLPSAPTHCSDPVRGG